MKNLHVIGNGDLFEKAIIYPGEIEVKEND